MSKLDSLYAHLPVIAQHGAVSAFGLYWHWLRFGPGFDRHVRGYVRREQFSPAEWHAWCQVRLRRLLSSAAREVPYYRDKWQLAEREAASAGRLTDLPLLEKDAVRANPRAFLRQDVNPHPTMVFHTSGTSGTPIASIWTVQEYRNALALREVRSARWAGVTFKMPRATFSGRMVEPDPRSQGPFYRYNAVERQTYLSPFHLSPATASRYVDALWKHDVMWLTGYAFSFYLLGKLILEQNLRVPPLKAIITTSEKVTSGMREVMEKAYSCRVYEEYSTVENAVFASGCEHGRLHVSEDAGIVEILRPDGTPCAPGEVGEVVATCMMRYFQIMIRFRLGDLAAWDDRLCSCGRTTPVLKEVVGRIEDVVVVPDGRQMVRFHGIFVNQPHVREGQIVQEALDNIRVKVVPTDGFGPSDEQEIAARVQQRVGSGVHVTVETVAEISRTSSGKFRAVVSTLPRTKEITAQ